MNREQHASITFLHRDCGGAPPDRERLIRVVGGRSHAVEFVIGGANQNCGAVACQADSPPFSVALFHTNPRLQLQHISNEPVAGNKAEALTERRRLLWGRFQLLTFCMRAILGTSCWGGGYFFLRLEAH